MLLLLLRSAFLTAMAGIGNAVASTGAGQGVPPEPIRPDRWVLNSDYPSNAIERGGQGSVSFQVTIDPTGRPAACFITRSSGLPELDKRSCSAILVRGKFKPARDELGQPIFGVYSGSVSWAIQGRNGYQTPLPDMAFSVQKLPGNLERASVTVRMMIDENGKVESCAIQRSSDVASIDAIACSTALARNHFYPALNAESKPVRAMQVLRMAFVVGPPLPPPAN